MSEEENKEGKREAFTEKQVCVAENRGDEKRWVNTLTVTEGEKRRINNEC